jgi:hypothetical protein
MKIIICGASAAGLSCLSTLVNHSKDFECIVISEEKVYPYSRCLLTNLIGREITEKEMEISNPDLFPDNIKWVFGEKLTKIDTEKRVYPAIDAKRGEIYTIEYKNNTYSYCILSIEKYIEIIMKNNAISVLLKDDNNLVETLQENSRVKLHLLEKIDLKIINASIEKNKPGLLNIFDLMPVYIRESDAEINLKRKKQNG